MPGRPDFTTPGSGGSGQTLAINDRPEIETIDATSTADTAAGSTQNIEVFAPSGAIYRVIGMYIQVPAPAGATTGDHNFGFRTASVPFAQGAYGKSTYTTELKFQYGGFLIANSKVEPSDAGVMYDTMRDLRATENDPILFRYTNNTDVANTGDISIHMAVEEVSY